jgi:cytochrome oxidase Cu insertion factor (SCO1/SenC/PrrC family)
MARHPGKPGGRRTLLLIVAIGLAPIVASYAAYYLFTPSKRLNYGELLETAPAPIVVGTDTDGKAFSLTELRGKWVLLIASRAGCADTCARTLYATRQARTIQGREQDRIVRLLLQPLAAPALSPDLAAAHPGLVVVGVDRLALEQLPLGASTVDGVLLLDPRGNLVLRYGADPDIRRLANDLQRVLKASQIG